MAPPLQRDVRIEKYAFTQGHFAVYVEMMLEKFPRLYVARALGVDQRFFVPWLRARRHWSRPGATVPLRYPPPMLSEELEVMFVIMRTELRASRGDRQ